jgi:haloalkane dehalogenase
MFSRASRGLHGFFRYGEYIASEMKTHSLSRRQFLKIATFGSAAWMTGALGSRQGIEFLRTPEAAFTNLPDYDFPPSYAQEIVPGLRMHYLDVGSRSAEHTFLCLHGQPTWSYLYRKMIPVFTAAGHRVVAPDWFGFGRSDKPVQDEVYTFNFHRESMLALVRRLDLKNVTLVVQDWGGLLGLTLPMEMPERFSRLIIMNTSFATGEPLTPEMTEFYRLQAAREARLRDVKDPDIAQTMRMGSKTATEQIVAAYNAPFPDLRYKAGARRFPLIVPRGANAEGAEISRRAVSWWSTQWNGQSFMAIGMQDRLLGPRPMNAIRPFIRNCPPPLELPQAGHFVQEDAGDAVARAALQAFQSR